mgnify:CR=1 FL=1
MAVAPAASAVRRVRVPCVAPSSTRAPPPMRSRAARPLLAVFLAAPLVLTRAASAQGVERITLRGRDGAIYDPAGRVQLVAGTGSDVTVELTRGGRDAGQLRVLTDDVDGRPSLRVVPPGDLVYPGMGRNDDAEIRLREDGTFDGSDRGRTRRVRIRGSGGGAEAWADLVVRVPAGARVKLATGVGASTARDVSADLELGTNAGGISTERTRGRLSVGAGSGRVSVRDAQGEAVTVGTGSGGARVDDVTAQRLSVGTGSGGIEGGNLGGGDVRLGTGSGGIRLGAVRARRLQAGAGSGSMELELARGLETARIGTGSGGVTLRVPSDLGATFTLTAGSGGISTDVPVQLVRQERGRFEGRVGDGSARVQVSTGSGGVRLVPAR